MLIPDYFEEFHNKHGIEVYILFASQDTFTFLIFYMKIFSIGITTM
jgi:hypothetical protein